MITNELTVDESNIYNDITNIIKSNEESIDIKHEKIAAYVKVIFFDLACIRISFTSRSKNIYVPTFMMSTLNDENMAYTSSNSQPNWLKIDLSDGSNLAKLSNLILLLISSVYSLNHAILVNSYLNYM